MPKVQPIFIALAAMLCAGIAAAQDRAPDWLKRPSLQDLQAVWPVKALRQGYGGKATINCIITVEGVLRACQVQSETPAGGGFGGAALALATQFRMRPALKGGVPVEATVQIPIVFPEQEKALGSLITPGSADAIGERIYTRLPWRQAPTYADMVAAYPPKARAAKVGGKVVLDCKIGKEGGISSCRTMQETPSGQGFAAAARTLIPRFATVAADPKGEPLAGRVHLPIVFPAAALEPGAPAIGKPQFTAMPKLSDFSAVISPAARQAKVYKARVVMNCSIAGDGVLQGCGVESEEPVGLGYGEAALRLSGAFRLGIWTEEGLPTVGGVIRFPLRFDLDEVMAAKAAP